MKSSSVHRSELVDKENVIATMTYGVLDTAKKYSQDVKEADVYKFRNAMGTITMTWFS